MKDIIYFIKESYDYENWTLSTEASNFLKDCIYDMILNKEINKDNYNIKKIILSIIDSIDELDDKFKYIKLKNILKQYPNTNFKQNINKIINNEIKKEET